MGMLKPHTSAHAPFPAIRACVAGLKFVDRQRIQITLYKYETPFQSTKKEWKSHTPSQFTTQFESLETQLVNYRDELWLHIMGWKSLTLLYTLLTDTEGKDITKV